MTGMTGVQITDAHTPVSVVILNDLRYLLIMRKRDVYTHLLISG